MGGHNGGGYRLGGRNEQATGFGDVYLLTCTGSGRGAWGATVWEATVGYSVGGYSLGGYSGQQPILEALIHPLD